MMKLNKKCLNLGVIYKIMKRNVIGLVSATCLVIGNMLGAGIYMMPANMALAGGAISIFSWLIILIGITALSLSFVKLNFLTKNHGGGPYFYVNMSFGLFPARVINMIYIIANLIAITSMLSIVNAILILIFKNLTSNIVLSILIQLMIIWSLTLLNIGGARITTILQSTSLYFVLIPIILIILFGSYYFDWQLFNNNINPDHLSILTVTNNAYNNIIWAFIGVESAVIIANIVKKPDKNIPIATISAIFIVAFIYIAVYICAMGVLGNNILIKFNNPLILVIRKLFANKLLENLLIITIVIDCISSILGWLLVTSHSISRSADDNLINNYFSKLNSQKSPYRSLILGAIIISITIISTASNNILIQFNKIINTSVLLYLVAYITSMLSLISLMLRQKFISIIEKYCYILLAIITIIFCLYSIYITNTVYLLITFFIIIISFIFSLRILGIKKNVN